MTLFLEALGAVIAVGFGIVLPVWDTHHWLRSIKVRVVLGILALFLFGGYLYYQHIEKQEEIESEKWDFARDTNTKESYCTYLKEYPIGIYVNQAENKCHPEQTVTPPIVQTPKSEAILVETEPAAPVTVSPTPLSFEPEMVLVKKGCFQMGSNKYSNERQHKVCIDKDFEMGQYEVTQAQWTAVMGSNSSYFKGDNLPVEQVSYNDIQDFIKKLNDTTHKDYRLPTEAEWEYACRGGHVTQGAAQTYCGGENLADLAWYDENSDSKNHEVGTKQANDLGVFDMSGNVWEWTDSVYDAGYNGAELKGSSKNDAISLRVLRGGSWLNDAFNSRSACRNYFTPGYRGIGIGFRLSRM